MNTININSNTTNNDIVSEGAIKKAYSQESVSTCQTANKNAKKVKSFKISTFGRNPTSSLKLDMNQRHIQSTKNIKVTRKVRRVISDNSSNTAFESLKNSKFQKFNSNKFFTPERKVKVKIIKEFWELGASKRKEIDESSEKINFDIPFFPDCGILSSESEEDFSDSEMENEGKISPKPAY